VAGSSKHVHSRRRQGNTVLVMRDFSLDANRSTPEPGEASAGVPTAGGVEALLEELDQTEVRDDKEHQHTEKQWWQEREADGATKRRKNSEQPECYAPG
jgi:hypothetical protein